MKMLSYFISGLIFGLGLIIGGMTDTQKVRGFLDFFGNWDPALLLVMGGAILFHAPAYRLIIRRPAPVYAPTFQVPKGRLIDAPLLVGAALFGFGWGLVGYCPGPALTSVATSSAKPLVFILAMTVGMRLHAAYQSFASRKAAPKDPNAASTTAQESLSSNASLGDAGGAG